MCFFAVPIHEPTFFNIIGKSFGPKTIKASKSDLRFASRSPGVEKKKPGIIKTGFRTLGRGLGVAASPGLLAPLAAMDITSQIEKDVSWFKDKQPSSENIVLWIWEQICDDIKDCTLHRIRLVETHTIHTDYYGPGK